MLNIILGNALCFVGMGTDSISAARKTSKAMLLWQILSQLIYAISSLLLGAYSAAVQNLANVLRNWFAIGSKPSRIVEGFLIVFAVVFGLIFNNLGIWGLIPVISTLQYSLVVFFRKDNAQLLRISFAAAMVMFIVFNAYILNIGGVIANAVVLVSTIISYLKERKQ